MAKKHFIAVIIIAIFCVPVRASGETHILQNCTVDDLHNISNLANVPVHFVFLNCNLSTLSDSFSVSVASVKTIEFVNSNISSINTFALSDLVNLEVLRIISNPSLQHLETWSTHNLEYLIELDLQNNSIHSLDTAALRRYPKLSHFKLQANKIEEIPVGFFDFSLNLVTLDLAVNSLKRIESYTFKALLSLVDLNISNNLIEYIDSYAFTTTTHLRTLRLNGNRLNKINSMVLYNLARLEYLNLSENALDGYAFEDETFHQNSKLLHLDVSHNSLKFQSHALRGLTSLQVLNGSNNQLTAFPSTAFKDLGNLKQLDIANNNLTYLLDNQFAFTASIESINISHNKLRSILPFTFTDLATLHTLDLSSNQLKSDEFLERIVVKVINLRNNAFDEINLTVFKSVGNAFLYDNPWNCSWLLNALIKKDHLNSNIRFGFEFDDFDQEHLSMPSTEEVECLDYRQSRDQPILRKIVLINSENCARLNDIKKKSSISTYPRTFSKLLSDEFDYKALLLWIVVAVCLVIGLVHLGKYCLEQSEKKSERYRLVQQEKVLKDIDEYFAKNTNRKQRS